MQCNKNLFYKLHETGKLYILGGCTLGINVTRGLMCLGVNDLGDRYWYWGAGALGERDFEGMDYFEGCGFGGETVTSRCWYTRSKNWGWGSWDRWE